MTPSPAERSAADSARRRAELLHDLRTPLTLVSGFADLLRRRSDLSDEQRAEYLECLAAAADQLKAILDRERDGLGGEDPD